jgi:DNA-binding transcriptional ArsR family regulator
MNHAIPLAKSVEVTVSGIAAAIGEPARARILYCLMDGNARTSTELAIVADVSPSTASMHLSRLKNQSLVAMASRGKHHYYRLGGAEVAAALEALAIVAGGTRDGPAAGTPSRLRAARTCYDHMAGQVAVSLHDRLRELGWLSIEEAHENTYGLTEAGTKSLTQLGIDIGAARALRRRFACACVDWSERRPHLGGALGAALLDIAFRKNWVIRDLDSRALRVTPAGQREMNTRFGVPGIILAANALKFPGRLAGDSRWRSLGNSSMVEPDFL